MPEAVGRVRYAPRASTVPRRGWWLILECDPDWYNYYARQVAREEPGRWAKVVDRDRVFEGQNVDRSPRLGLIKPLFLEPAWGPHISVVRGSAPTQHQGLWKLHSNIGDAQQEVVAHRGSRDHWTAKAAECQANIDRMNPGVRAKRRRQAEESLQRMLDQVALQERRLLAAERALDRQRALWKEQQREHGYPDWLASGAEVDFTYDPDLRMLGTHWWLRVECPWAAQVREFYGLPPEPEIRLHLTVGVTESSEGCASGSPRPLP